MTHPPQDSGDKISVRKVLRRLWKPRFIAEWTALWREHGFRGFVKKKGWKFVAAVVLFYLIRDALLYLVLPYLAIRGLF